MDVASVSVLPTRDHPALNLVMVVVGTVEAEALEVVSRGAQVVMGEVTMNSKWVLD